jgi:hypothetical protein
MTALVAVLSICLGGGGASLLPAATAGVDVVAGRSRNVMESPAVERAGELMRVVNGASRTDREAFVQRAYAPGFLRSAPASAHLNFLAQLYDGTGGVTVHSVVASAPMEATVVYVAQLTGEWRELTVQVDSESPHRITRLQPPRPIPPPPGHTPARRQLSTEKAAAELHEYARRLAEADVFSGGVLVARGDNVLFHSAYGAASREFGVPNRPETRFISCPATGRARSEPLMTATTATAYLLTMVCPPVPFPQCSPVFGAS